MSKNKTVEGISTHQFAVNDLDWSHHYNYLLSGGDDMLALIHDLNIQSASEAHSTDGVKDIYQKELDRNVELDKSLVRVFKEHTHHVTSCCFDAGTSLVLTGSVDRTAILWDIRSSQYVHKIEDHAEEIYGVDISNDGNLILTAGKDGFVRIWETRTSLWIKTIKVDLVSRVGNCFFTPDSKAIIANNVDYCISAYDVSSSEIINRYKGHSIPNGYFLKHWMHIDPSDNIYILSGSEDGWIYGWDVDTTDIVLKENVLDSSKQIDNSKEEHELDKVVDIEVPGETISSNAIITCVDSSQEKQLIGWVDSYRNITVFKV